MTRISSYLAAGVLLALIAAPSAALANSVVFVSPTSFIWPIDYDDHGEITNSSPDQFDNWPNMCVGQLSHGTTCSGSSQEYDLNTGSPLTLEDGNREVVMQAETLQGLSLHRKIFIPATGSVDFARYLNILTNNGGAAITLDVRMGSTTTSADLGCTGAIGPCQVTATSAGGTTISDGLHWWVIDDQSTTSSTGGDAAVGVVAGNTGAAVPVGGIRQGTSAYNGDSGDVYWQYDNITVPANSTVIYMFFVVQAHAAADAATGAAALALLSGQALTGMSATEIGQVQNFNMVTNAAPVANPSASPTTVNEGSSVAFTGGFTDADAGDTHTFSWTFGDGGTSTSQNPTHTYAQNGSYTAAFTVTDNSGASDTENVAITVNNVNPTVTAAIPGAGTVASAVSFSSSFTDPGTSDTHTFFWDFGDGGFSTAQNPSHLYGAGGTFNVTVTVTDSDQGSGQASGTIVVNAPPVANAGPNKVANEGTTLTFSGTFSDPGTGHTFLWDFGDGSTATTQIATHAYADNGTYVSTFTVTDSGGLSDSDTLSSTINNANPTANAGPNQTANEGSPVSFTGSATDPGIADTFTYLWDFGDGSATTTTQNPTHTYSAAGTYTATLTVTDDDNGSDQDTAIITVNNQAPVANAGANQSGNEGAPFTFSGTFTDGGTGHTFLWDFGDGTTATTQTATHSYADNGTFTATFTVTDSGNQSGSDTATITVNNVNPIAIGSTPSGGAEGSTLNFTGGAVDDGTADTHTFLWNFGDGTTSTTQNPTHSYADNNTYHVTLTVTDDDNGSGSFTNPIVITNVAPTANAGPNQTGNEGSPLSFTASQTDPGTADTFTYLWDFGDGTTSTLQTATKTYADNGTYTVTLTVTDDDNGSDQDTATATITNANPVVNAGPNQAANETDLVSFSGSFTDAGTADTHTFLWNFGDGTTATTLSTSHAYTAAGTYTVTLTVTDDDNGSGSDTATVTINNTAPIANAGPDQTANEGSVVSFNGTFTDSGSGHTFLWNFGDGTATSTLQNPTHTYADNGAYTATFTVTDPGGGVGSDTATVTVNNVAPTANAGPNRTGGEGSVVTFLGSQTDPGNDTFTYLWDFGDGTTATTQIASHVYADNGTFTVTLTVTDDDNGTDQDTATATITNVNPTANAGANQTGVEGDLLSFTATATDPGAADTFTYLWDFGDGTPTSTQQTPTHTYADNGSYTVTLTVTDDDNGSDQDTATATITNANPVVNAGPNQTVSENSPVTFSGSFSDAGTGDTHTFLWDFGDGTTSTASLTPTHTYAAPGTFTATLTVTDDDSGVGSDTMNVTVQNLAPTVSIQAPTTGNEGDLLTFTGSFTDGGSGHTFLWDFGDGTTATTQNATHTYADNNTYSATFTVTDSGGSAGSAAHTLLINNVNPVAGAGADLTANEGDLLTFTATATDAGSADTFTYLWDFGDGTTSIQAVATHTYADNPSGTATAFTVTLTVTDDDGGSSSDTLDATISNVNPVAGAGGTQSGTEGDLLTFTATATDAGTADTFTYLWDFGDSTTSTQATPTHTYTDNGAFTVTLTVTDDDGGSDQDTAVAVIANALPVVSAGANQTANENDPLSFSGSFSDAGSADTHTFVWDFGDGNSNTTSLTPTHTYTAPGTFTVTLTVTDDDGGTGADSLTTTIANTTPVVSAGADQTGDEGDLLSFSGSFTDGGSGHTFLWDFGDGTTDTTTLTPTHTYADDGTFTVTLTVTDPSGATGSDTLDAVIGNVAPVIGTPTLPSGGDEGDLLTFSATATDAGTADTLTFLWDFGDGTTASTPTASHTYTDNGSFTATLTVTDDDGASAQTTPATIPILNAVPVVAAGAPPTGNEGDPLSFSGSFSDAGSADTHTFLWDFGDGTTDSTTLTPTHTYTSFGSYTVTLTVTDDDGGVGSDSLTAVAVNVAPVVNIGTTTSTPEGSFANFAGSFTDGGTGHTFVWDFGDGTTNTTSLTPSHTYADDGTFTVTLTVTDAGNSSTTATESQVITNVNPSVNAGTPPAGHEGDLLSFSGTMTDAGSADTLTFIWDFGDGSTDTTSATPTHTYLDDGTFTVTLTVTDDDGGVGSDTLTVNVANAAPSVDSLNVPSTTDEGTLETLTATYSDPGPLDDQNLTFVWDFGDGTTDTGASPVVHQYADDGTYTVTLTVTDPDGASDTETAQITAANVAPEITSTAPAFATEGTQYTYNAVANDPGTADVLTWTLGNGGATWLSINPATGEITGTPPVGSDGTYTITLVVEDDDGASDTQIFTLTVGFVDDDGDGMADVWETANGLDPTDPADALLDPDGDNINNLDEFLGGTDPNVNDGPTIPSLLDPIADSEVADNRPTLELINSTDPQNDPITYDFQVFDDLLMTNLVAEVLDVPEDTAGTTAIQVADPLTENTVYAWRARASDGTVYSVYSDLELFFVNEVNEEPDKPVLADPIDDQEVDVVRPLFTWSDFADVDRDAGSFDFQIEDRESGQIVVEAEITFTGLERDSTYTIETDLEEDGRYLWRVRGVDEHFLEGEWSDAAEFVVNTDNAAPSEVVFLDPLDGDQVEGVSPVLTATESVDPEGVEPVYVFEVDSVDTFDSGDLASTIADHTGTGEVSWDLADEGVELTENTTAYARVRAEDDLGAASPWDVISFFVRGDNDAPSVPVLLSPEDGLTTENLAQVYVIGHSADPEGDDISYEIRLTRDEEGSDLVDEVLDLQHGAGPEGTADQTSWRTELSADGTYYWTARAVDDRGAASEWADVFTLTVETPEPPPPDVPEACAECESSFATPAATSRSTLLLFAMIALFGVRRRRS